MREVKRCRYNKLREQQRTKDRESREWRLRDTRRPRPRARTRSRPIRMLRSLSSRSLSLLCSPRLFSRLSLSPSACPFLLSFSQLLSTMPRVLRPPPSNQPLPASPIFKNNNNTTQQNSNSLQTDSPPKPNSTQNSIPSVQFQLVQPTPDKNTGLPDDNNGSGNNAINPTKLSPVFHDGESHSSQFRTDVEKIPQKLLCRKTMIFGAVD